MDQIKFYKYVSGGLLLLNVVVIAFFLIGKPRPPHHSSHSLKSEIIKILDLDSQQESAFRDLADEHRKKITSIKKRQQKLLLPYFESLTDSSKKTNEAEVLNQLQQLEGEKLKMTYLHFEKIGNLLNEEQLPHFKGLMNKLVDELVLDKNNKPRPPKNFD